ncbi:MAG: isoprenoid biosynthesis glyoxalase ElbB [Candidatus Sumerlaeaceae bacterium]
MAKRVALLLSGCGVMDGSEIHEASFALLALDQAGAEVTCCAPDAEQAEVVNHATGKPTSEKRNILVEAARIARGKIKPLDGIRAADFDALIMPGGYGAAKNLCSYAREGCNATVAEDVGRVLREFHAAGKVIGSICISPMAVAAAFKGTAVCPTLTIGNDTATAKDLETLGGQHQECSVRDFVVDKKNRIVTTPAYMYDKGPADVFTGIEKLVKAVVEMA